LIFQTALLTQVGAESIDPQINDMKLHLLNTDDIVADENVQNFKFFVGTTLSSKALSQFSGDMN